MEGDTLAQAMARFGAAYTRFLRAAMPTDAPSSYPRLRLLSSLAGQGPTRVTALAHALGVTPHNITKLVDALHRDGLVERHPDPTDRRATLIALTPAGRSACDHLEPEHAHNAAAAFATLTSAERDNLLHLITKVTDHLDDLTAH